MLSDYHGVHCSCFTFVDEEDDLIVLVLHL
jgi:hypothetical protein